MINILYISIEGNTKAFIDKLIQYATQLHQQDSSMPLIQAKEIDDMSPFAEEQADFFAFVPTYLDGGNGIDNGVKELMTNALGEYIAYETNAEHCRGVIGSGNRNFNQQYCLTARRYAQHFNAPFLADYELRGTQSDVKRIYDILRQNRDYTRRKI
ncbi:MAG TPA: class Ib ribonucleoside-diphosphate reductase assembly flavoprotein NrdI [Candidatus Ligilactobacillus excrementigallinarum]|uniref:Class Ib ribonucleoside-diphosphate reductase assembly flavoprotein NrdI n=1 Tax=Candidatus Ligilactobacillus excrementigallinarum TaxID=2838641 RepID=A0A9D2AA24_9LACO|nr:class Ib ribonucleoside-diphosphate reductase assembly flavoprotein NrdI [Candidatus Ligilactobacillus excrementigallinarum]